jgi:hypothetical protein
MSFFYDLNNKLNAIRELPSTTHGQLNERDMSRAAKGYEKYGKEGMEALAKAGREGKALDPVRDKYNKYDESVEEGFGDVVKQVGSAAKKLGGRALNTLGHGDDADMIRDLQKKMGVPQTGMKPEYDAKAKSLARNNPNDPAGNFSKGGKDLGIFKKDMEEAGAPMTPKQKSFAKLAPPADKITFADKIAGAKKEVDEMLGDVAAEAMKNALGGKKQVVASEEEDLNPFTNYKKPRADKPKVGSVERGHKHDIEHTATGRKVTRRVDPAGISVGADDDKPADGEKRGRGRPKGPEKAPERVTGGATKHKGGRKVAKEGADYGQAQQIYDDLADIRAAAKQAQRGGEFPQGFASRLESVLYAAMTLIKNQQSDGAQVREEEIDEKAVSKKQQKFMGMVHAAQKGEKPASKEVAKTAKSMGKKDAEDFAATKHKGLPEKKKSDDAPKKKKEKTQEAGGTDTPTASSGFSYGKGIYDSINREIEEMIAESMSVTMSMNNDTMNGGPGKNLTVNATDEDAVKLASILKMAGMGGGESSCGCGQPGCDCAQQGMDEAYGDTDATENAPDYPTETETSADPFQYSGGINKPKSTGQTTVPVIASQEDRQHSYAEAEEDAIKRMMEMAGVKKKEVDEEKTDEGNKFTGNLAKARADGKKEADLDGDGDMEKVKESIFDLTNQWQAYKG